MAGRRGFRSHWLRAGEVSLLEAARRLGLCYNHVRALIARGELRGGERRHPTVKPGARRAATHRFAIAADVERLVAAGGVRRGRWPA